jgi:hypothetical protein
MKLIWISRSSLNAVRKALLVAVLATFVGAGQAHASSVGVFGDRYAIGNITAFYNTLSGVTATTLGGSLDSNNLSGFNLLWLVQPASSYTAGELAAMQSYLGGGGRIAFMGEHGTFAPSENLRINAALSFLGANIQIQNVIHDPGFRSASVSDGQILSHSLTAGVSTYEYAAYAPLTISGSATALMIGEDQPSIMMAYQNVGGGSIFLITDQNVWDGRNTWGSFDNETMFENLISASTAPVQEVPEPVSMVLLGIGICGAAIAKRRGLRS